MGQIFLEGIFRQVQDKEMIQDSQHSFTQGKCAWPVWWPSMMGWLGQWSREEWPVSSAWSPARLSGWSLMASLAPAGDMWIGRVDCSVAEWMQRCSGSLCPWRPLVVSLRALGPVLFNPFITNMDSGIERTLSKFAVTRNLCPAWEADPWETPGGPDVQEVHLAQGNPRYGYRLGGVTGNNPAEELGVGERLDTSQQCALAAPEGRHWLLLFCVHISASTKMPVLSRGVIQGSGPTSFRRNWIFLRGP